MWDVVREDRPQADGDHRTGGNAETGDDGRGGGKVLGHSEGGSEKDKGTAGRGGGQTEEASGGTTAEVVREDSPQVEGDHRVGRWWAATCLNRKWAHLCELAGEA